MVGYKYQNDSSINFMNRTINPKLLEIVLLFKDNNNKKYQRLSRQEADLNQRPLAQTKKLNLFFNIERVSLKRPTAYTLLIGSHVSVTNLISAVIEKFNLKPDGFLWCACVHVSRILCDWQ